MDTIATTAVGWRNIGDQYVQVHIEANFRNMDIAAAGPVVREISSFWTRLPISVRMTVMPRAEGPSHPARGLKHRLLFAVTKYR